MAVLLVLLLGAIVVAAPSLLSTPPVRQWLVEQANSTLAPGKIELEGLSASWTQPLRLTALTLVDPHGKSVLTARRIRTDRGLLGLLTAWPDLGLVVVDGAALDIERRPDGSIDLRDALGSLLGGPSRASSSGQPERKLSVRVRKSTVRLVSPELAEPLIVSQLDADLTMAPGEPLGLVANLAHDKQTLQIRGHYDLRSPEGGLALTLQSQSWPLAVRRAGITARGQLDGQWSVAQEQGLWNAKGNLALSAISADGPALSGDRLTLDRLAARADVTQTAHGWSIQQLDVSSPVGGLTARGTVPAAPEAPTHLEGSIDLAALARMLPRAMRLREGLTLQSGLARVRANLQVRDGTDRLDLTASLSDLAAIEDGQPIALREPIGLTATATRTADLLTVEKLVMKAAGIDVTAQGDLDRGVTLSGTVDLAILQAQLGDLLDLGDVDLSGRAGLAADYRRAGESYQARFAAECRDLRITGLTEAPFQRDRARLDASAVGLRAASGLPANWQTVRLGLKAGDAQANLAATRQNGALTVAAVAGAEVRSPTPGRAELKLNLRWQDGVGTIDNLRAGLVPAQAQASAGTVALAVRGRYDRARGELVLTPIPGEPAGALCLTGSGLRVSGLGGGGAGLPWKMDAALAGDLAACDRLLAAWSGSSVMGLGGAWSGRLTATQDREGRIDFGTQLDVANLTTPDAQGPVTVRAQGRHVAADDRLELPQLHLQTAYGRLAANLRISELSTRRLAVLNGTLEPAWPRIDSLLAGALEPQARVRGGVRPLALRGSLAGGSVVAILREMEGEVGLNLTSAYAFGMTSGPAPVVLRLRQGRAVFDPIQTTLNGGTMVLQGDLALDQPNLLALRLAQGSRIDRAAINDEVSSAVLAYVAPILSQATQATGNVSVTVQQASFPLLGAGTTRVEGELVFQDVQFEPGPFATEILTVAGQKVPRLALNQPLQLQVSDGRVRQSGLAIDVASDAKIDIQGSVGFDQTVQLQAAMPLPSRLLPRDERIQQIAGGTRVMLPIGGTLERPRIDRKALEVALRDAARSMVQRGLESGASELLNRVLPPEAGAPKPGAGNGSGNVGRSALKLLEGLGREVLEQPRKP